MNNAAANPEDTSVPSIPQDLKRAQEAASQTVLTARKSLRTMIGSAQGWERFSRATVEQLHLHAVAEPNAQKLSDFLCETIPSEFINAEKSFASQPQLLATQSLAQGVAADLRMRKLRSAVIEAGLAEQLNVDGSMRQGRVFSAEKLEQSLDDWMRAGRHRGAEFDSSPLSVIDALISKQSTEPQDGLNIRCGLLIPVVMAIHIWRTVEQYPDDVAQKIGWPGFPKPSADSADLVDLVDSTLTANQP